MYRCPHCGLLRETIYVHHGRRWCAHCLPTHPEDDLLTRCAVTRIRCQATRGERSPPIGVVEVYYPEGMRSRPVPAGDDLLVAAMDADDLWEAEHQRVRVRVVKFLPGGERYCICHLPPVKR